MSRFLRPEVTLVASTKLEEGVMENLMSIQEDATDAETLTEWAGRVCYKSEHRPNPATAKTSTYLEQTVEVKKHKSIAEHASATLYFRGVSRSLTHELIRHRHLSYSQLSQRFVNESSSSIVQPPALRSLDSQLAEDTNLVLLETDEKLRKTYDGLVSTLMKDGLARKQAREAARCVLPNMSSTEIVVTGNLRAWMEVIERRTAPDADAEIQEVMNLALRELNKVSPVLFPVSNND